MNCIAGGPFPTSRRDAYGIGVQPQRGDQKEGNGGLVQPGVELERCRRTCTLDGHEGVSAGANLPVARVGSVIAFRARLLNVCFR